LDGSLQWGGFRHAIQVLRDRGNDVLVVVGPFNEHMIAEEQRPTYRALRDGITSWLRNHNVPAVTPETLPIEFYADASHPLTEGYALLGRKLFEDMTFRAWVSSAP
jgi:hypothetical protein